METEGNVEIVMENVKLDEIGIGMDTPQVEPKKVKIVSYLIESVTNKENKVIGDKLVLKVKHPDLTDQDLEISQVKYQNGDKLKVSGIWVNLDKDSKIPFKSALACMLRYLNKAYIKDLIDEEVETVTNENGYLVIKGY